MSITAATRRRQVEVNAANPSARIPHVLTDEVGNNPVKVNIKTVLSPDGSTQVFIHTDPDQRGVHEMARKGATAVGSLGSFTDQHFGITDRWGNPRATLRLHTFAGQPGETVRITVGVDDSPPATITVGACPGVPMEHPQPGGDARRFVHLPDAVWP